LIRCQKKSKTPLSLLRRADRMVLTKRPYHQQGARIPIL
jgi:hypothetical protein